MTTVQNWVDETKRLLLSGERENLNVLNGAISSTSATTFVYTYSQGGIIEGATVEIDLELMYVVSVNTGTKTATVIRGMFGSTAATHSNSALITVNPRFPQMTIYTMLGQELADLSSPANGLYKVSTAEVTYATGTTGYNLNLTGFLQGIELHYEADSSAKWWKRHDQWRIQEKADTTDFAQGRALMIGDIFAVNGTTMRLTYRAEFVAFTSLSDDVLSVCGLYTSAHDIPPLGVAARLMIARTARRNFDDVQGEPRRAMEVEPRGIVESAQSLLAIRQRRITAEVARLHSLYPYRLLNA